MRSKVMDEIKDSARTRKDREIGFYENPENSKYSKINKGKYGS